jgi:predicted nucleic acid-binding protein
VNYLLDTCVISELARQSPQAGVVKWIQASSETNLYLSVLTSGELRKGVERLPASRHKYELDVWLTQAILNRFASRVLPLDLRVAQAWGTLAAQLELKGRKMPSIDALIAATALSYDLTLVTRNVADFAQSGLAIINPWE